MKCAHCKRQDPTVTIAHVRSCSGLGQSTLVAERPSIRLDVLDKLRNQRPSRIVTERPSIPVRPRIPLGQSTSVPAGHYALLLPGGEDTDGEPVWRFFEVDRPTEGRWKGYTFISRCASDERYPVRDRAERTLLLELISRDVTGAMAAYGRQIGKCGKCHRTLTNPESIGYGIGPECRNKIG